ncbi:hypothetical protein PG993_005393 [Apiospora rasikravindrae]|uniref:Uncharacterized protein n=1 Tax=Apiospora rasikravindrae TaxID=990691 RepID=A0ABR1TFG1_9PEZI
MSQLAARAAGAANLLARQYYNQPTGRTRRNRLARGAIAGIVIAAIAFLAFLLLVCFCCRRRRNKNAAPVQGYGGGGYPRPSRAAEAGYGGGGYPAQQGGVAPPPPTYR